MKQKLRDVYNHFGPFAFFYKIAGTLLIGIFVICFFLYPAWITLRVGLDTSFHQQGINSYTLGMFKDVSHRFSRWGSQYLNRGAGSSVNQDSVSETEWPMFGAAFYLLTAEEVQKQYGSDESLKKVMDPAVEVAVRIVADPRTAAWVKERWGDDYLNRENVFYRMLLIQGLTAYEKVSHKTTYRTLLHSQVTSLGRELEKAPHHLLDDYPGECYPSDVLWSVAGIRRADVILGTDHSKLAEELMSSLTTHSMTEEGVPAYMAEPKTGKSINLARGCNNSGILIFAPELNRDIAAQWFKNYQKYFWQEKYGVKGFREFSTRIPDSVQDADSGPVVKGFGSVASVFGIGACRTMGRLDLSGTLARQIIPVSYPTFWGLMIPSSMGKLLVDSGCLGEVALVFSLTRPVPAKPISTQSPGIPLVVWMMLGVYLIPAALLIWVEYRHWKKWLKSVNKGQ